MAVAVVVTKGGRPADVVEPVIPEIESPLVGQTSSEVSLDEPRAAPQVVNRASFDLARRVVVQRQAHAAVNAARGGCGPFRCRFVVELILGEERHVADTAKEPVD